MYTVYVLMDNRGKFYKGMTNNIKRRFKEHLAGKTKTTFLMSNLKIVYQEEYKNKTEARQRELYFKTAAGRKFLKKKFGGA